MGDENKCTISLNGDPRGKVYDTFQIEANPECDVVHPGDGIVKEATEGVVEFFQAAWNKLSSIIQGKGDK